MQSEAPGKFYADLIAQALKRFDYPLPVELVQAVIKIESGGVPGLVNSKSGASGLGQVMPAVVHDYGKATGEALTMADMQGKTNRSIRLQISVTVWILGRFWRSAYNYLSSRLDTVPIDELTKIADLFYVAGPGATRKKLQALPVPLFENVETEFPSWNALPHVARLLKNIPAETNWQLADISDWLHTKGIAGKLSRDPKLAAALAILVLGIGSLYLFKKP